MDKTEKAVRKGLGKWYRDKCTDYAERHPEYREEFLRACDGYVDAIVDVMVGSMADAESIVGKGSPAQRR